MGRINYISQRRSFGVEDKAATARLYNIASNVTRNGGSSFSSVDEFPGYTYGNEYDNEEVDFDVERIGQITMIQQQLCESTIPKCKSPNWKPNLWPAYRFPKQPKQVSLT